MKTKSLISSFKKAGFESWFAGRNYYAGNADKFLRWIDQNGEALCLRWESPETDMHLDSFNDVRFYRIADAVRFLQR